MNLYSIILRALRQLSDCSHLRTYKHTNILSKVEKQSLMLPIEVLNFAGEGSRIEPAA